MKFCYLLFVCFQLKNYSACQSAVKPVECGDTLLPSMAPIKLPPWLDALNQCVPMTLEGAQSIEKNTTSQSKCELWHNLRQKRLTASTFARVIKRKKPVDDKFLESIFPPNLFPRQLQPMGVRARLRQKKPTLQSSKTPTSMTAGFASTPNSVFSAHHQMQKYVRMGKLG